MMPINRFHVIAYTTEGKLAYEQYLTPSEWNNANRLPLIDDRGEVRKLYRIREIRTVRYDKKGLPMRKSQNLYSDDGRMLSSMNWYEDGTLRAIKRNSNDDFEEIFLQTVPDDMMPSF